MTGASPPSLGCSTVGGIGGRDGRDVAAAIAAGDGDGLGRRDIAADGTRLMPAARISAGRRLIHNPVAGGVGGGVTPLAAACHSTPAPVVCGVAAPRRVPLVGVVLDRDPILNRAAADNLAFDRPAAGDRAVVGQRHALADDQGLALFDLQCCVLRDRCVGGEGDFTAVDLAAAPLKDHAAPLAFAALVLNAGCHDKGAAVRPGGKGTVDTVDVGAARSRSRCRHRAAADDIVTALDADAVV